jgi:hypothetical protein
MKHLTVRDNDTFLDVAIKFQVQWNLPNVTGCIGGKYIQIKCPPEAGTAFNYKQVSPVVVQGVADSECRFISIDIGTYGKQSDGGGTFSASNLYHLLG